MPRECWKSWRSLGESAMLRDLNSGPQALHFGATLTTEGQLHPSQTPYSDNFLNSWQEFLQHEETAKQTTIQ